jgi:hypothetical protein
LLKKYILKQFYRKKYNFFKWCRIIKNCILFQGNFLKKMIEILYRKINISNLKLNQKKNKNDFLLLYFGFLLEFILFFLP